MRIKVGQLRAIIREELHRENRSRSQINEIFGLFEKEVGIAIKSEIIILSQKLGARCRDEREFARSLEHIMGQDQNWINSATRGYLSFKSGRVKAEVVGGTNKTLKISVTDYMGTTKSLKKPEDVKNAVDQAKKEFQQKMMEFKEFMAGAEYIGPPMNYRGDIKDFDVTIDEPRVVFMDPKTGKEVEAPKKLKDIV